MELTELENEVFAYFAKISKKTINKMTTLNNDLQVHGDDAFFLLKRFSEKFKVDLTNLNLDKYFVGVITFKYWYYKLFKPEKFVKPPLTIGHLIDVVRRGMWFEPNSDEW